MCLPVFVCLSVRVSACLSFCPLDNSKSYDKTFGAVGVTQGPIYSILVSILDARILKEFFKERQPKMKDINHRRKFDLSECFLVTLGLHFWR